MPSYAMTGNGNFGGSNNFLSILGGIGNAWGDGIISGMNMGKAIMDYQKSVYTNPSATRAQIAQNIANQGTAEGTHYRNSIMNPMLSQLAGGGELADWQRQILNQGYVNSGQGVNSNASVQTVQGTPLVTQTATTPATTPAQPTQPSTPMVLNALAANARPMPYNPYGAFNPNPGMTNWRNNTTGIPYRPAGE
nr:MAG TPA: hypothetical protein [Caudoviricetes sp.]